jgi:hypothetical protein
LVCYTVRLLRSGHLLPHIDWILRRTRDDAYEWDHKSYKDQERMRD